MVSKIASNKRNRLISLAVASVSVALLGYFAVSGMGFTGSIDASSRLSNSTEFNTTSGDATEPDLRLTLDGVRLESFFTVLDLRVEVDQHAHTEVAEIAPLAPAQLKTSGFDTIPVNIGSIGMGVRDEQSGSTNIQILVGPVSDNSDSWSVAVEHLTVRYNDEHEWTTVFGPWHFEIDRKEIGTFHSADHIEVDKAVQSAGKMITIDEVLVTDFEIAVTYIPDLGGDVLPMGHEIIVRTDDGEYVHGQSVPAPRTDATDTRMKVFPVSRDDVSTIDVVPGRYVVTEEKSLDVTIPLPYEVLGPVDELVSVDMDIQVDQGDLQTTVFGIQSGPLDDDHSFLLAASSMDDPAGVIYLLAPGRDEIRARDDIGNEYLYGGGSFGEGWYELSFQGPLDTAASELTVFVNRVGREIGFVQSVKVDLVSGVVDVTP